MEKLMEMNLIDDLLNYYGCTAICEKFTEEQRAVIAQSRQDWEDLPCDRDGATAEQDRAIDKFLEKTALEVLRLNPFFDQVFTKNGFLKPQFKNFAETIEWTNKNYPGEEFIKLRPITSSGQGRFTSNSDRTKECELFIKAYNLEVVDRGNDKPKGGKTGDFIKIRNIFK